MANRDHPAPTDADNSSGSTAAACIDWRVGDADSMSARATPEPTVDAGYTTAGVSLTLEPSISFLHLRGSPYMTCYASSRPQLLLRLSTEYNLAAAGGSEQ